MTEGFDLQQYMAGGIERIVKSALKASLSNPRESVFVTRFALASRRAAARRRRLECDGEHIPPFLIASITSRCNLHCAGCYARANNACADTPEQGQLTACQWLSIFEQACGLGVGFILLAGGEPLMRQDVLEAAGRVQDVLFPVFTNGLLLDGAYIGLFDRCRNLVPILSIEGDAATTDERRGAGVYERLVQAMERLQAAGILYGVSITVTTANVGQVTRPEFLDWLYAHGCKAVIYVEFVPVTGESRQLAPGEEERRQLERAMAENRSTRQDMICLAFPGDEKATGGCLAAGRGFFHINSRGGAEPCPFSPYSDINVAETSLREALRSNLFTRLKEQEVLLDDHTGGCVLFEKREVVEQLLTQT